MRTTSVLLLFTVGITVACDRRRSPDPRPMVQKAMHGMFVYPKSVAIEMAAGEDAAQITLSSPDSVGLVASWFRQALPLNGWQMQSDVTGQDHSVSIVAMKGARPLWVTLRPNVGAAGTTYTVIGAVVAEGDSLRVADSAK
jgi:hypothetical protein